MKLKLGWRAATVLSLLVAAPVAAQEFGWVGARAAGMGGVGVAVADDASAVHFNPAGLGFRPHPDTIISGGGTARDRQGFVDAVDGIGNSDRDALAAGDPAETAAVLDRLDALSRRDAGLDGFVHAAVLLTQNGAGLSVEGLGWVAARPVVDHVHVAPGDDPAVGIANNTTSVHFRGLELQEGVVSYSYSILPGMLTVGVNAKYVRGTTYEFSSLAYDLGNESRRSYLQDGLDKNSKQTNRFAYDVGVLVSPLPILRVGATARYINEPSFSMKSGETIKIQRQVRIGAALSLDSFRQWMLAADVDLAPTTPQLGDRQNRFAGVGFEYDFGGIVARAGARTDLESSDRTVVPTAGLGFGSDRFRLDVGAGWRSGQDGDVAVSLRWSLPN